MARHHLLGGELTAPDGDAVGVLLYLEDRLRRPSFRRSGLFGQDGRHQEGEKQERQRFKHATAVFGFSMDSALPESAARLLA